MLFLTKIIYKLDIINYIQLKLRVEGARKIIYNFDIRENKIISKLYIISSKTAPKAPFSKITMDFKIFRPKAEKLYITYIYAAKTLYLS